MTAVRPHLAARSLTRRFGYRTIFREVSFDVEPGQALVLLGPNGSGKTTLLRVLAGLLTPSAGSVEAEPPVEFVAHQSMLYDALTARENLRFFAQLLDLRPAEDGIVERLAQVGLTQWSDERVASFSHGMRQRLAIARALLHEPRTLLLDEPYNGLDQDGIRAVNEVFRTLRESNHALVTVTHDFARAREVATHAGFLVGGRFHGPEAAEDRPVASRYQELTTGA